MCSYSTNCEYPLVSTTTLSYSRKQVTQIARKLSSLSARIGNRCRKQTHGGSRRRQGVPLALRAHAEFENNKVTSKNKIKYTPFLTNEYCDEKGVWINWRQTNLVYNKIICCLIDSHMLSNCHHMLSKWVLSKWVHLDGVYCRRYVTYFWIICSLACNHVFCKMSHMLFKTWLCVV